MSRRKKGPWIDKSKPYVKYRVIHRSQADSEYYADDVTPNILERVHGPDLLNVDASAFDEAPPALRDEPAAAVPDARFADAESEDSAAEVERIKRALRDEKFEVELKFPKDGYDYSQHLRAMGEGTYSPAPGMEKFATTKLPRPERFEDADEDGADGGKGSESATVAVPTEVALCLPREVFAFDEIEDEYGFAPGVLPGDVADALDDEIMAALNGEDLGTGELDDDFMIVASRYSPSLEEQEWERARENGDYEDEDEVPPPLEPDGEEDDEDEGYDGLEKHSNRDGDVFVGEYSDDTGMLVRKDEFDDMGYKVDPRDGPAREKSGVVIQVSKNKDVPAYVWEHLFQQKLESYGEEDIGELEYGDPSLQGYGKLEDFEFIMDEFLSKQVQGLPDEKDRVIRDYEEDQLEEFEVIEVKTKLRERWDVESVTTMHTDTENHPSVIHDEPVIRISRKTGLPIGPKLNKRALKRLAERQRRKELAEKRAAGLLEEEEDEEEDEEDDDMSVAESVNLGEARKKNESKEEKKARKQAVKEMRRARRAQKKQTKMRFKSEELRQKHRMEAERRNNPSGIKF